MHNHNPRIMYISESSATAGELITIRSIHTLLISPRSRPRSGNGSLRARMILAMSESARSLASHHFRNYGIHRIPLCDESVTREARERAVRK